MGTKRNPGTYDCYVKAYDDEPLFVLLARAPMMVRTWAACRRVHEGDSAKVQEAMSCAQAMEQWKEQHS